MKEDLSGFKRLILGNPHFRRLWFSHMISLVGDWLSYIAVSVISIQQGGGAFAVGMVMFVHSIPLANGIECTNMTIPTAKAPPPC